MPGKALIFWYGKTFPRFGGQRKSSHTTCNCYFKNLTGFSNDFLQSHQSPRSGTDKRLCADATSFMCIVATAFLALWPPCHEASRSLPAKQNPEKSYISSMIKHIDPITLHLTNPEFYRTRSNFIFLRILFIRRPKPNSP